MIERADYSISQCLHEGNDTVVYQGLRGAMSFLRDLKPHNVLYDPQTESVTLLDFGIASRFDHESEPGQGAGALAGTLAYMSPEQTGRMNR